MLEIVIKGFVIGILVSIPVGPIAILCIQRTLSRGRYHGFATGVGAALSDLFYGSLAVFSLTFILSFIEKNQAMLEFGGAALLLLLGIYIYLTNPLKTMSLTGAKKESYFQDFISAFFLTLTNPLIIFLFLALFARFQFVTKDSLTVHSALGLLSVFMGAAFWWFLLSSIVSVFRAKIDIRGLRIVNKIAGAFIALIALVGLYLLFSGNSLF